MSKIIAPTNCPVCDSKLERVKDQLFCRSTDCAAQNSKKLQHFCKILKIKGFGEKTLEKLEYLTIPDLMDYTVEYGVAMGLGEKTALNLESELSKMYTIGIDFALLVPAMGIDLIGTTAGRKLSTQIKSFNQLTFEIAKECGLGDKAVESLIQWIEETWPDIEPALKGIKLNTPEIAAKTVINRGILCITGKLLDYKNRAEASAFLHTLGWECKTSVTKKTDYLICEDGNTTSSSCKKALSYNIEILTIKELLSRG